MKSCSNAVRYEYEYSYAGFSFKGYGWFYGVWKKQLH
jgi:hypothetical protein